MEFREKGVFLRAFVFLLSLSISCSSSEYASLSGGSSLSVENINDALRSPNGIFTAGFHSVGDNAYCFAVWFNDARNSNDPAVVWMANRDLPVNGKRSELLHLKSGNLVLSDAGKSIIWATNTTSNGFAVLLLDDTGNLILRDSQNIVLWQSFDFPTDTLLPYQNLTRFTQLVSSRRQGSYLTGYYKMFFDNGNLLRLLYDGPTVSSIYWPYPWLLSRQAGRNADNNTRIAFFDPLGKFNSSDSFSFITSDYGRVLQRRLKLDFDGNARMYSRESEEADWYVSWEVKLQPCQIHGMCGPNTTCGYDPYTGGNCACLPGYKRINATDWSYGCEPDFQLSCSANESRFLRIKNLDFYGYDYGAYFNYTYKECKSLCLQLCNCKGFQLSFTAGNNGAFTCYPKTLLLNGYNSPNFDGNFYLRLPKNSFISNAETFQRQVDSSRCSNPSLLQLDRVYTEGQENATVKFVLWFASAMGSFEVVIILLVWCFFIRNQQKSSRDSQGNMYVATGFRKFSYQELKEATKGFNEEIGRGAGATVYLGVLSDHRVAAIKYLNGADQGEQEFLAEVNVIGRLNHMNLIEMWGYCVKGKHRLLVYEYMKLGSLADNLQSKALNRRKRYEIALGIARGLAYLHEECLEWILHCDVKPQNILLDTDYHPKIADFGLSKLLKRNDLNNASSFSRIRGTRGYMAPEWVYNAPITSKVDVYSYGIVVLEMLTGKNPAMGIQSNEDGGEARHTRLVTWVREKRRNRSATGTPWVEQIMDPMVEGDYDAIKMKILAETALDCVNEDRETRPSMSQVVKILEN